MRKRKQRESERERERKREREIGQKRNLHDKMRAPSGPTKNCSLLRAAVRAEAEEAHVLDAPTEPHLSRSSSSVCMNDTMTSRNFEIISPRPCYVKAHARSAPITLGWTFGNLDVDLEVKLEHSWRRKKYKHNYQQTPCTESVCLRFCEQAAL